MLIILSTTSADAQYISTLRALGWKGQAELVGYDPNSLKSASISSALAGSVTYTDALALPGLMGSESELDQIRMLIENRSAILFDSSRERFFSTHVREYLAEKGLASGNDLLGLVRSSSI